MEYIVIQDGVLAYNQATTETQVMVPTLSSATALEVVIMTTSGAVADDKVGIIAILGFRCSMY